ncbi:MAG: hypothetical protein ACR2MY_13505 [Candidatus Dormibacteria bacterium]
MAPTTPGPAPLAVLRDVAGGPAEYLLGSPGGRVVRLGFANGFSPPRLAGTSLFFSIRHGLASFIYRGSLGGCAHRLATGSLGEVEDRGRALTALVDNRWVMLDAAGHQLTPLTGAAGSWTLDGRLVEPTVAGIDIYDLAGHKRSVAITGLSPMGSLGPHQELVSTATGLQLLDLDHQALHSLKVAPQEILRAASGSPDGTRIAYLDQAGAGKVLEVETGSTQALAAPALATGFAWSRDSQWVEVQTVYGGAALHLADGHLVDTGALVVVSW